MIILLLSLPYTLKHSRLSSGNLIPSRVHYTVAEDRTFHTQIERRGLGSLQQCNTVNICMRVNGIVTQPPFCIICCQAYLAHVDCAHSMQGRLDKVLSTEICLKVSERIQIVLKMQVSILRPAIDTLCCLLLHGFSCVFGYLQDPIGGIASGCVSVPHT